MTSTLHDTNSDSELLSRVERGYGRTFDLSVVLDSLGLQSQVRRLVRAGRVAHVSRGIYTILERPRVPVLLDDDFLAILTAPLRDVDHYVSWRAALSRHGLTEQDPRTVSVAVRVRRRARESGGSTMRPVYQSPGRFFGYRSVRTRSGGTISIATPEKAIIDSLDRPDLAGGLPEVVKALGQTSAYDAEALVRTAKRYPSKATIARLGYLMTLLAIGDPAPLRGLVRRNGPATPSGPAGG